MQRRRSHDPVGVVGGGGEAETATQAAVAYATAHGATDVILYGWSMGGGIVESYLHRGDGTQVVKAVVLQRRTGIDLARINMVAANRRDGGPHQPVLLFHGTQDDVVPFATSALFAREWPGQVTWVPVAGAGHTRSWNLDPTRYDQALSAFLKRVDPPG